MNNFKNAIILKSHVCDNICEEFGCAEKSCENKKFISFSDNAYERTLNTFSLNADGTYNLSTIKVSDIKEATALSGSQLNEDNVLRFKKNDN